MPRGSKKFEYCLDMDDVDVPKDKFQLQSSSGDGVCITSLSINNLQLFVGKNNNLPSFWIDRNDQYCLNDFMSTSQIIIQNEQVISSLCKNRTRRELNGKKRRSLINWEPKLCKSKFARFFPSNFTTIFASNFRNHNRKNLYIDQIRLLKIG